MSKLMMDPNLVARQILFELDGKDKKVRRIPHRYDYINYSLSNLLADNGIKPSRKLDKDQDGIIDCEDCDPWDYNAQGFLSSVRSAVSRAVSTVSKAVSTVVSGTKAVAGAVAGAVSSTASKVVSAVTGGGGTSTPSSGGGTTNVTSSGGGGGGGGGGTTTSSTSGGGGGTSTPSASTVFGLGTSVPNPFAVGAPTTTALTSSTALLSQATTPSLTGSYVVGKGFVTATGQVYPTTNPNFVPSGYTSLTGTQNVYVSGGRVYDSSGSSYVGNVTVPGTGGKTANQITNELQKAVTTQLGITPSQYNTGGYSNLGIPVYSPVVSKTSTSGGGGGGSSYTVPASRPGTPGAGTFISDAGVFAIAPGVYQSMAQAPKGSRIMTLDEYKKEQTANYRKQMYDSGIDPDTGRPILVYSAAKTPGQKFKESMGEKPGDWYSPYEWVTHGSEWAGGKLGELRRGGGYGNENIAGEAGAMVAGFGQGILDLATPIVKIGVNPLKGIPEFAVGTYEMGKKAFTTGFPEVSQALINEPSYSVGYIGGMVAGSKLMSKVEVKGFEMAKEGLGKAGEYLKLTELDKTLPVQVALKKSFSILEAQKIDVGTLRLNRLTDIPKDVGVHNIIKDFAREKGLVVGGTTAIETMRVNNVAVNLRRIPRDLELYDPMGRNPSVLAKELYNRLQQADKQVTLGGNGVGFKGIEGHGVNFQDINRLNIERYRYKIWTNPEGIKIADPVSTAYNKVADMAKSAKLGTKRAETIKGKLETPEKIERATAGGKIYERFPKDVSGAFDVAEQMTKLKLKEFADFQKRQIPLYQEYKMLKLGQSMETLKPFAKAVKVAEEVPVKPFLELGKGQPLPGVFSGAKHIKSYTLELNRRMLADTKGRMMVSTSPMMGVAKLFAEDAKAVKKIASTYEYVGGPKPVKIPQVPGYPVMKMPEYGNLGIPSKPVMPGAYPIMKVPEYPTILGFKVPEYPSLPQTPSYPTGPSYPQPKAPSYPTLPTPPSYPTLPGPTGYPTPPTPKAPSYPTYPIPPMPKLPSWPGEKPLRAEPKQKAPPEKSLGPGYDVYGKIVTTNKFVKINTAPIMKERAKDIGAYYVENTLARTFRIKPANARAKPDYQFMHIPEGFFANTQQMLRQYKIRQRTAIATPEQYIQKSRFMLSSAGEKAQIKKFQDQVMKVAM